MPLRRYATLAARHGVVLPSASIALYDRANFFLNGEAYEPPAELMQWLKKLADYRQLSGEDVAACADLPDLMETFHHWTLEGWLQLGPRL